MADINSKYKINIQGYYYYHIPEIVNARLERMGMSIVKRALGLPPDNYKQIQQDVLNVYATMQFWGWSKSEFNVSRKLAGQMHRDLYSQLNPDKILQLPAKDAVTTINNIFKTAKYDTINKKVFSKLYQDAGRGVEQARKIIEQDVQNKIKGFLNTDKKTSRAKIINEMKEMKFTRAYADNVFRTNTAKAVSGGQYNRSVKSGRIEGFKYMSDRDSRVRPNHEAARLLEQPIDSKYWNYLYPPLGFNCRCEAVPILRGLLRPFVPASIGKAKPDDPSFGIRPKLIL